MLVTSTTGAVKHEDVAYLDLPGGALLARLYHPPAAAGPALVSVHGGTWTRETRLTNAVLDEALAARGILVMAVDFRLPPAAMHPAPVHDIQYALRWLKHHAAGLGADPARTGIMGTSSGGHQAMLCALRPADFAAHPGFEGVDAAPAFAVAGWGVLDPLRRYRMMQARNEPKYTDAHEAYFPDTAAMARDNPTLILQERRHSHLPRMLVLQGDQDHALPPDMAENFAGLARNAGGRANCLGFVGVGHTFITKQPEAPQSAAAIAAIADFVLSS